MGLCNSLDILQEKINELFTDLDYIRAYIDDIIVLTKSTWEDHFVHLEQVSTQIIKAGIKVNANKTFFGKSKLEYLGYYIT